MVTVEQRRSPARAWLSVPLRCHADIQRPSETLSQSIQTGILTLRISKLHEKRAEELLSQSADYFVIVIPRVDISLKLSTILPTYLHDQDPLPQISQAPGTQH